MKKTIAGGVWPVMITPFTEDNKIDYDAVLRIIEWYDKNGVDGIFAVCQSSEMFELSPQERVELAKFIINNTPKHMGVIASGHCAEKVEDQIREAQTVIDAGVDAYVFISNQFAKENESEDVAKKNIEYLVEGKKNHTPKRKRMYYKNLGEITHYVADYFTFPHNKTYPGSLKDHCAYEEKLKQDLRAFLKTEKAKQIGREKDRDFASLEELFSYVKQQHEAYLKKRSNVEKDIEHIVVINRQLVDAIAQLFHNHKSHHKMA